MSIVRRHTLRLKKIDYSQPNLFFITICVQKHRHIFTKYPELKKTVNKNLINLNKYFPNIEVGEYIIMPNHLHFLLKIKYRIETVNLGKIILVFKSKVINDWLKIIRNEKINESASFWQRNYYERIVRNCEERVLIEKYIRNNLINWNKDKYFT